MTVAPGQVKVKVLNGTTTAGLAGKAADDLAAVGFAIAGPAGNAPEQVGAVTVVSYDPRYDQSAKTVAAALPGSTLTAVAGLGRTIQVTVGTSYKGATQVKVATAAATGTTPTTGLKARTAPRAIGS